MKTQGHEKVKGALRHTAGEWWAGRDPWKYDCKVTVPHATRGQIPSTESLLGSERQAKCLKCSISFNLFSVAYGGTAAQRGLNRVSEITELGHGRAPFDPGLSDLSIIEFSRLAAGWGLELLVAHNTWEETSWTLFFKKAKGIVRCITSYWVISLGWGQPLSNYN